MIDNDIMIVIFMTFQTSLMIWLILPLILTLNNICFMIIAH